MGVHRIKVLMVGPAPPQLGGMEAFVGELLKTNLKEMVNLYLFNISKPKLTGRRSNKEMVGYDSIFKRRIGLTLQSYSYSFKFLFQYIFRLFKFRPQIVHVHTASYTSFWEKIVYIFIAKAMGCKVILHSHGGFFGTFYDNSAHFAKVIIRKTLNTCDVLFVLSESWKQFFEKLVPGNTIKVVANGIHLDPFQNNKLAKTHRPSFLFVGRVGSPKGVYELLEATHMVVSEGVFCTIYIMGAGELEETKNYAVKLNIESNVEILGPKYGDDKYEYFSKAWCFVLPSHAEGMPITILESFAAGLPVISTKVGAIPSVVKDGENGFLVEKQNVKQLAECMVRMIKDEKLRNEMSRKNNIAAEKKYNITNSADIIYTNYQQTLNT